MSTPELYCKIFTKKLAGGMTDTATFRFDRKTLELLKQEAKTKNVTLNSLINSIISQYIDWYSDTKNTNHVHLWKQIPVRLLERCSDSEIREIAREVGAAELKDTLMTLEGRFEIISFFDALQSWLKASRFTFGYNVEETKHKFVIQFNMSRKWSLFIAEIFRYLCDELKVDCSFDIGEKVLIFEADVKR